MEDVTMRFSMNVSSERSLFAPCAGCVLPVTSGNMMGSPVEARNLTRCFMLIRLNSAEKDILSVDEDNLARLGAYLQSHVRRHGRSFKNDRTTLRAARKRPELVSDDPRPTVRRVSKGTQKGK